MGTQRVILAPMGNAVTIDEMRVELGRLIGGDRVYVRGGACDRVVEVFNGTERVRRVVGLRGTVRDVLTVVLEAAQRLEARRKEMGVT